MISVYYSVKPGESLAEIARRYRIEAEELIRLNLLDHKIPLIEGQHLRIPIREPLRRKEKTLPKNTEWLTVLEGETADKAAKRAGISRELLLWLNGIRREEEIHAGQRLRIRP